MARANSQTDVSGLAAHGHEGEQHFRLAPHLRLVSVQPERAYLLGEHQRIPIVDAEQIRLFEWLVHGFSMTELGALAGSRLAHHLYALDRHVAEGHVVSGRSMETLRDPHKAWAASMGRKRPMPRHSVALDFLGPTPEKLRQTIVGALLAADIDEDPGSHLRLLVVDNYLNPEVGDTIARLLELPGTCCIPFRPFGQTAWIGPIVGPGQACWACLTHRLLGNSPIEASLAREAGPGALFQNTPPSLPQTLTVASAFAAARLLALPPWQIAIDSGQGTHSPGHVMPLWTMDLSSLEFTAHAAPWRPQCPVCGDPTLMTYKGRQPVMLHPRPKAFLDDGGHRVLHPEATHDKLKHLVSPITGLVSNLGVIHGRTDAVRQVYGATHFITPARGDPLEANRFEMMSVGKGRTAAQARTSALCEALERQCARHQGDELAILATLSELDGHAIAPPELLLFSDRQYATRSAAGQTPTGIHSPRSQQVPESFDPEQRMAWTPAWSLSHQRMRWVPLAYGFAGTPLEGRARTCNWDSNGCATGNCLEEAVLQALLELVERDAAAIYWYNRIPRPEVTPETFGDPCFEQIRAHYSAMGHDLWVLDITHDLGAWVFFAIARERKGSRYAAGLGCHLDPAMALHRALSELHQVFDPACTAAPLWDGREVCDATYLMPAPALRRPARDYVNHASDDLAQDVAWLVDKLRQRSLETLVLDYSRPDVPLQAVKAIVPGSRHFWPRYAPGRLYDVPVSMGWRQSPLSEDELNPLALRM